MWHWLSAAFGVRTMCAVDIRVYGCVCVYACVNTIYRWSNVTTTALSCCCLMLGFFLVFLSLSFSFILSLYLLFLFLSSHSSSLIPYWHINFNMCTQTPNSYKEMRCILNTLPSCLCEFHVFHLHLSDAMKFMSQSESVRYAMRHSYLVGHRANKCKLCMMRRTNCNYTTIIIRHQNMTDWRRVFGSLKLFNTETDFKRI